MKSTNVKQIFVSLAGSIFGLSVGAYAADFTPISYESDSATIRLAVIGTYRGGYYSKATPTAPDYDPVTKRLFVGSLDRKAIDVLNISNPYSPKKLFAIDLIPYGGEPNSLAVKNGVVAVTVKNTVTPTQPNKVVFFNVNGNLLKEVELPHASKVVFTPDSSKVVVTISGPVTYSADCKSVAEDLESAVAILNLGTVNWEGCRIGPEQCNLNPTKVIADFVEYNKKKAELIAKGVRIYGPRHDPTVAQDFDTESFTISPDSHFAYVSLERNNALAVVDLEQGKVTDILPAGYKDHSQLGNGFDASDKDSAINIQLWPVRSYYQIDGIAPIVVGDQTFLVTANEGDPKDDFCNDDEYYGEKVRVRDLQLDQTHFPNASFLKNNANLGRLQVTNVNGDTDRDGDFDELYMLGSRSFAIWKTTGQLVFDSGDAFEQITAKAIPSLFNTSEDSNEPDARSDDRGPEPEHLAVGEMETRQYVFIGFERIGGIMAYDITNPDVRKPTFEQYINNRNAAVDPSIVCGGSNAKGFPQKSGCEKTGDLEVEGVLFISREESPIDVPLLVVNHELSDSTTVFRIDPAQCAFDVSNQVSISRGGYRYNRSTQHFVQVVTLKNSGTTDIKNPVHLALDALSSNATLYSPAGATVCAGPAGSPYLAVNVGVDNVFSPGESATVVLEFVNPSKQGITYNTRLLASTGNR